MLVTLNEVLTQQLGWRAGMLMVCAYDPASLKLRLSKVRSRDADANVVHCTDGCARVRATFPQVPPFVLGKRPVPFIPGDRSLTLFMPQEWMRAGRPLPEGLREAEREDLREAIAMIRQGTSNLTIMEHFGWTRERVEGIRVKLFQAIQSFKAGRQAHSACSCDAAPEDNRGQNENMMGIIAVNVSKRKGSE